MQELGKVAGVNGAHSSGRGQQMPDLAGVRLGGCAAICRMLVMFVSRCRAGQDKSGRQLARAQHE